MGCIYIYTIRNMANGHIVITGTAQECAEAIGVCRGSITRAGRMSLTQECYILKKRYIVNRYPNHSVDSNNRYYQVYLRKTGELVCAGTSAECTKALGLANISAFRSMNRAYRNGIVKKWIIASVPYSEAEPILKATSSNASASTYVNHHRKPREPKLPRDTSLWFSVYLKKTDTLICSGTAAECAKALGMKNLDDFHVLAHKVRKGTNKKYEIYSEPYYEDLNFEEATE